MSVAYSTFDSVRLRSGGRVLVLARAGALDLADIPYEESWGAWRTFLTLPLDAASLAALKQFWKPLRGSQPSGSQSDQEIRAEVAAALRGGRLSCILQAADPSPAPPPPPPVQTIAWGNAVSAAFKAKAIAIAADLQIDPDWLMAIMNFESGGTFSSDIQNRGGSHFYGLIQAGAPVITGMFGLSVKEYRDLDPVDQLDYVKQYFEPYAGRMHTLSDAYMVVLWPRAVGKAETFVLFQDPKKAYQQNKGLDADKDKKVTKAEATAAVQKSLTDGQNVKNAG
jgi:hypothetical protein